MEGSVLKQKLVTFTEQQQQKKLQNKIWPSLLALIKLSLCMFSLKMYFTYLEVKFKVISRSLTMILQSKLKQHPAAALKNPTVQP